MTERIAGGYWGRWAWPVLLGTCHFSGTPLSPGVLDQPLKSDVCRERCDVSVA